MRHKLRGKMWEVERVAKLPNGSRGMCDSPDTVSKKIQVLRSLNGVELLEVLLHESLHACLWDLDEQAVGEIAADQARLIWKEMGCLRFDG
jgi:hypothetical protein